MVFPGADSNGDNGNIMNILKELNITAFLDDWGPIQVLQVYDPNINMHGFLVIDNISLGPGCGGIRISPTITPHEIFQNARKRTWSCALANVKLGGAAAGIRADPSGIDKIKFVKSCAKVISPFVPDQFIAAPDMNTGQDEMAGFVEEIGDRRGATGKPENLGGIPHELGVIGFGMGVLIKTCITEAQFLSILPSEISETRIAIQGFDNIGFTVAKFLENEGAKIVAISDEWCTLSNPSGIEVTGVLKHSCAANEKHSLKKCKDGKKQSKDDITKIDCHILVTTTGNGVVQKTDTQSIKAKCIVEGINNPIDEITDQILYKKGILILPDILTNTSCAISSYAEYNMESSESAFSLIESRLKEIAKDVIQRSLSSNLPLRRVAKEMAKERILDEREVEE